MHRVLVTKEAGKRHGRDARDEGTCVLLVQNLLELLGREGDDTPAAAPITGTRTYTDESRNIQHTWEPGEGSTVHFREERGGRGFIP